MSGPLDGLDRDDSTDEAAAVLERVLELVAQTTRVDLRAYRRPTLFRRLRWQAASLGLPSIAALHERLTTDPALVARTATALLVGTTSMFRDAEVFAALAESLVELVARREAEGATTIRCWVPACSTGAEAYSLGICLAEATDGARGVDWRVLATDIDEGALATAARGRVGSAEIPEGLAAGHLRWLTPVEGGAAVRPEVMSRVTFVRHDLLNDVRPAPAAAVVASFDVVSCRNLLIYLEDEARLSVCKRLVKACAPGALLVLGRAERLPPQLASEVTELSALLPLYAVG